MGALAYTVAFEGVEARPVEVQCAVSPGVPVARLLAHVPVCEVEDAEEARRLRDTGRLLCPAPAGGAEPFPIPVQQGQPAPDWLSREDAEARVWPLRSSMTWA